MQNTSGVCSWKYLRDSLNKKNKDNSKAFCVTRRRVLSRMLSRVHFILENYLPLVKVPFLQHSMPDTLSIYLISCKSWKKIIFWIIVKFPNGLNFRLISCLLLFKIFWRKFLGIFRSWKMFLVTWTMLLLLHSSTKDGFHSGCSEVVVRRCSVKKIILKNFAKFTGKHLRQGVAGLRPPVAASRC